MHRIEVLKASEWAFTADAVTVPRHSTSFTSNSWLFFFCWGNLDPNQKMGPSFMSPCNLQLTIAMKESYAWIQIHTPSVGYYHVGSHWTPLRIRFKKKRKYMSSCVYTSVPKFSGILLFFFYRYGRVRPRYSQLSQFTRFMYKHSRILQLFM